MIAVYAFIGDVECRKGGRDGGDNSHVRDVDTPGIVPIISLFSINPQ
jgi:hypothetical protein